MSWWSEKSHKIVTENIISIAQSEISPIVRSRLRLGLNFTPYPQGNGTAPCPPPTYPIGNPRPQISSSGGSICLQRLNFLRRSVTARVIKTARSQPIRILCRLATNHVKRRFVKCSPESITSLFIHQ